MTELEQDFANIYLTGDTHGSFRELVTQAQAIGISKDDLLIILGDVGLNFDNGKHDTDGRRDLYKIPATILCIHGNHERRPTTPDIRWKYTEQEWMGGIVWIEENNRYPRILFAKDGCRYTINGRTFFVIGGAYSVDKPYRIKYGYPWFDDEQPSEEIKWRCLAAIEEHGLQEDIILSHTCPHSDIPLDCFKHGLDENRVDTSTERFLQIIKDRVTYNKWYCGHWHIDRETSDVVFVFKRVLLLENLPMADIRDI